MRTPGFSRFVGLDENTSPELFRRVTNEELPFDGEGIEQKTGVRSRLVVKPNVDIARLARETISFLAEKVRFNVADAGGLVLANCFPGNQQRIAEAVADSMNIRGTVSGIDAACSGFSAGTEQACRIANERHKAVFLITTEVMSRMINWERPDGNLFTHDDARARGKAAKIFGDASAGVLVKPPEDSRAFDILDAYAEDFEDEHNMLSLLPVENPVNADGEPAQGTTLCVTMPGRSGAKLLKQAPLIMARAVQKSMKRAARYGTLLPHEKLNDVVPHQANRAMIKPLSEELPAQGFSNVLVHDRIADQGNVSSASVPNAIVSLQELFSSGAIIAMPTVGAGSPEFREGWLTEGCVLVRCS